MQKNDQKNPRKTTKITPEIGPIFDNTSDNSKKRNEKQGGPSSDAKIINMGASLLFSEYAFNKGRPSESYQEKKGT